MKIITFLLLKQTITVLSIICKSLILTTFVLQYWNRQIFNIMKKKNSHYTGMTNKYSVCISNHIFNYRVLLRVFLLVKNKA